MLLNECDGYNEYSCDSCEEFIGQYDSYGVAQGDRYDEHEKFHYCVGCRDKSMGWIDVVEDENGNIAWIPTQADNWDD